MDTSVKEEGEEHSVTAGENVGNVAEKTLQGWSKLEKYNLFQGLKSFGLQDIRNLKKVVDTKTEEEVSVALEFYKKLAVKRLKVKTSKKKLKNKISRSSAPLSNWVKLLTDSLNPDYLKTETATALRLIADFEDIPDPSLTSGLDFRTLYHMMANATEGLPIVGDRSSPTMKLFEKCLLEAAMASKVFIKPESTVASLINSVNLTDKLIYAVKQPTDDEETAAIQHLNNQRKYNPLNIPEQYLQPSIE